MPLYEFNCAKCGEEFEKILPSSSKRVACPKCKSRKTERKFSLFGMKSGGKFTPSKGGSNCQSCSAKTCNSCK